MPAPHHLLLVIFFFLWSTFLVTKASGQNSKSLESTGVIRQVYRSGNAPLPALAPDMNDGSGDYLDYADMSPEIGARVQQPHLVTPQPQQHQQHGSKSSSFPPPGATSGSGVRPQIRGKPKSTHLGNVRRGNIIYARYRMESLVEVPVATIDQKSGRQVPLKGVRIPIALPVPSLDQLQQQLSRQQQQVQQQIQQQVQQQQQLHRPRGPTPAPVRTLQEEFVMDSSQFQQLQQQQYRHQQQLQSSDSEQQDTPGGVMLSDGTQYFVIQNPDGSQNLVVKHPGQPVMMTPLPRPPTGSNPASQKYIIKQGHPTPAAQAAISNAQSGTLTASQTPAYAGISGQKSSGSGAPVSPSAGSKAATTTATAAVASGKESISLQDKFQEKVPDVLINYGTDDLLAGEVGKTLDNGMVRMAKMDASERQELLQQRQQTQQRMKQEWEERLSSEDHMDSED